MLNAIVSFSLRHRALVLLLAISLMVAGAMRIKNINIDVFPDVSAPTVTLLTEAHGLEAEDVEQLVTHKLETALNGTSNVRRIRSNSAAGISIVWVEFDWGVDVYRARQLVSERLPMVKESLPNDIGMPMMAPISSIMGEIMLVAITSDKHAPMDLRTTVDWMIRPRLQAVPGVANVVVLGGEYQQLQVRGQYPKMLHYGVGINDLVHSVEQSNVSISGGVLNDFGKEYLIKGDGRLHNLSDLAKTPILGRTDQLILSDVATIGFGASDKIGDASMNNAPAIVVTISKQPTANTLELTNKIDAVLEDVQNSVPEGILIHSNIFRQSTFIDTAIHNLQTTLWEGALGVLIILFIFLRDWRTTFISLMAIPISLITAILVLDYLNYDINTMSLGGLAIAIGVLVDDAIIDVENVYKRLRENWALEPEAQQPMLKVIQEASYEIRSSIIVATLIVILSFMPLFFLQGMEGRLLLPLGIAFIVSVLTSLIVAMTVTPVLCSYLLTNEEIDSTPMEKGLAKIYTPILHTALGMPKIIVLSTVSMFLGTALLIPYLGQSFLPEFNEGSLIVSAVGKPGTSLEESNNIGALIENRLLSVDEIHTVTRRTGRAELDEHAQGVHASELDVPFELRTRSKNEFLEEIREKLSSVPGVNISIGQPIAHRIDHMLSGTNANIAIKIFGPDLTKLQQVGNQISEQIESIIGVVDVVVDQQITVPQIRVIPNRVALREFNMSMDDFMHQVETLLAGEKVGTFYDGPRFFDINVRLDIKDRVSKNRLADAPIKLPNGELIPLGEIAELKSLSTPSSISRENVERKLVVAANVAERDLESTVMDIQDALSTYQLPEGYRIEYGGQFESAAKASQLILLTSIAAILGILGLLFIEFSSWRLAGIVLLNLPLALIGGILSVYFSSGIVSIASMIGFISLFGIATRNGILLISRYEDLRQEGMELTERLTRGALDRLNPILMTTCTTGLALVPLAVKGDISGNEIQSPMAMVILGGLLSATILNVIVMPCVVKLVESNRTAVTQNHEQITGNSLA